MKANLQHLPYFLLLLLFMLLQSTTPATSRPLSNSSSIKLISDGTNEFEYEHDTIISSRVFLNEPSGASPRGEEPYSCEQMYGFLPCSESVWGHVFLILVYEYLLFHGEWYVASGGERIFKILGPGVFGACAFQIIGSLPEALILLASGLLYSKEEAQELVLTGVGLVAGSSILLLTLVWGTCVILATQHFRHYFPPPDSSSPSHCSNLNPPERFFSSLWPGYGVVVDSWTVYIARLMLVSAIPFAIMQFPRLLRLSSSSEKIFVVATLVVSVVFLLSYFFYQLFQPWIQKKQLLYIKQGHLVVDILKHVQIHTMGNLFADDGGPNLSIIRSIFKEADQDGDKSLTAAELKGFLREIKFNKLYTDKDRATEDILKEFDIDYDRKITIDEFVKGMEKWIEQTKKDSAKASQLNEVLQPWIEKKKEEREMMRNIIPEVLEHLQASIHGRLLTQDGTPDLAAIKRLFKDIDHDKDDFISHSELKDLMMDIKYGSIPQDTDAAASKIMEELDISGDQLINEDEFVSGLSKLLNSAYFNQTAKPEENKNSDYQKNWDETDKLVEDKLIDKSVFAWMKAISLVVIGIVILGLLAEPLIHSVQNLSTAANIPSFFIAFIFVPFATNARIAVSAFSEARRKKININSLTFSEIYGTVLMNNLLGFSVLLSLIYFRGLSWNFSIEVLMVLIVCAVMGFLASFSTVFPVWTSLLAFAMYPLSLVLVNVLGDFGWLSQRFKQVL